MFYTLSNSVLLILLRLLFHTPELYAPQQMTAVTFLTFFLFLFVYIFGYMWVYVVVVVVYYNKLGKALREFLYEKLCVCVIISMTIVT